MPKREKFGKFVLLEEVETSGLGSEYRAAKLSPTGLEKIVAVLKVRPDLSANADVVKNLMDQVKFAAQLTNPSIVKLYGVGKAESSFYVSHEFLEGKSLQAIFARGRQEAFPFSVDHALLIASKVCSALEYAHGRKTEAGTRYFHGLVTPANVVVSYEGDVRTRGFGYWPARVREAGGLTAEELLYLSPEQADGAMGDTRSDTFAVGALLFQMLTGERFFQGGREIDVGRRIAEARLHNPTSDDDALPKPIREVLRKSLALDPGARFAEIQEMRKGVDTLLFSGDFAPTTFNLAFFMHSLFRQDIDRESKTLKEEREASYGDYLTEDVRNAPRSSPGIPVPTAAELAAAGAAVRAAEAARASRPERPAPAPAPVSAPAPPAAASHAAAPHATMSQAVAPQPASHVASQAAPGHAVPAPDSALPAAVAHAHAPHGAPPAGAHATPAPGSHAATHGAGHATDAVSAREAAAGLTFHKPAPSRGKLPMVGGIAAVVLIAAAAGVVVMRGRGAEPAPALAAPAPTTLGPEAVAALARVKELEEKLRAIEAEKAEAEAEAEEDARMKVEAQAAARGQAVDPAALARAQDAARKKAQAEQERKAQEERQRLEEEQKLAEAQLAEERRRAEEARAAAAAAAAATTPPPPVTTFAAAPPPPPTTVAPAPPTVRAGTLVDVNDPGVIAPLALNKPTLPYPPIALRQRIEGKVDLSVLVDERGAVTDAKLVTAAGGKSGLNEAASEYVRRWKFRPASKDGVPVKTWTPVSVVFMLPR
jgi:TonB family protein